MNLQKESNIDFLDVTQQTQLIQPPAPPAVNPASKVNYSKICEEYWASKGLMADYAKGVILGTGDRSNIYLKEFIKKFQRVLKQIILDELKKAGQTSEKYKDDFKALEHLFNILINHLAESNIDIKDVSVLVTLQGFVNAYIQSIINVQENGA